MSAHTILVVEDNPITRKMVRVALESEGYAVVEAGDGRSAHAAAGEQRPDLIILDYVLPDTDGMRLLADLRREPGCEDVPALVVTGMVSRLPELRAKAGELAQFLPKPIEPSRLLEVVRAQLSSTRFSGSGRTVLVVDDDPLNLKLAALRLRHEGYAVATASGGAEALEQARAARPDAILAHAGMPAMDGFALCRQVRGDPALAAVPVVLFSSVYGEEADRELARKMGANAMVVRSPDLRASFEALREALHGAAPVSPAAAARPGGGAGEMELAALHRQRVQAQLDRQTAQNRELQRQAGIQATVLALMRSLSEVLGQPANVTEVIGDVLVECLDAAGLSTGLLYLVEAENRYRLQAHCGIANGMREDAESCFGHPELIHAIAGSGQPVALASPGAPGAAPGAADGARAGGHGDDFLARLGRAYALVVPFVVMGKIFGVLVLASDHQELSDPSWLGFAGSLAVQFGQTVALGQSLNRLGASEERYRALMDQAGDAILVLDAEQRILEANRAASRLLGRPREEIVGRTYDDFVAPEELAESQRNRRSLAFDRSVRVPLRHLVLADGSRVAVEVSTTLVRIGDGSTVLAILRDITERRSLEAQFQQAQKMESVGRLAGGVAHDFNNLLTLILGYGNLVRRAVADRPAVCRQVEAIVHAGESAAALTRQLLAFSRRQVLASTVIDVNALIVRLEEMLHRLIGEDIELVTDLEPRLARIRADAGQIEQVLMNLVINARDAMPAGGRLTVTTRNHPPPPSGGAAGPGTESGVAATHVVLAVADTGSGIDGAVMSHLFEPFFTTKEEGKGTGLGLATVYGIVQQTGGRIEVASQPGAGATFTIHLPCTEEPVTPPSGADAAASAGGHETILVAEDAALIRSLVRAILEEKGYVVLEAAGADEALRVAESHMGPIHLLLTDVIMLGRSGVELAAALVARRPGLRVIYMSGYTDRDMDIDAPGAVFLQKPFDTRQLAHHVRAALDQG